MKRVHSLGPPAQIAQQATIVTTANTEAIATENRTQEASAVESRTVEVA